MANKEFFGALTLGPALYPHLRTVLEMNPRFFRYNFAHGLFETNVKIIQDLKNKFPDICIYADLKGLDQRFELFPEDIEGWHLQTDQQLVIHLDRDFARSKGGIYLWLPEQIQLGQKIWCDDAKVEMIIHAFDHQRIVVKILVGGYLKQHAAAVIEHFSLSLPPVDSLSLEIIRRLEPLIDGILASHIRDSRDMATIQGVFSKPVIAKIENKAALEHLEEIADSAHSILIARGDLSMAYQPVLLPQLEKNICSRLEKFSGDIILATGFWETLTHEKTPHFSDLTDLYYALSLGINGFLLTGETAVGDHPDLAFLQLKTNLEAIYSQIKRSNF